MNRVPLRRLLAVALAACLGISLLAGCSPAPDLDETVAGPLQTRVAAAKQFAAEQDLPAALAELQQLSQDVSAAAGQGKISQQRRSRIDAAISAIRTDLEAAMAPAPQPTATAPAGDPPAGEDQKEQAEEAKKEAEEQREEAKEEADKKKDQGKGNR